MNMRYKVIITSILFSIFLYSITHTDWIGRIQLLFIEKYAPNEHPAIKNRTSLVSYLKTNIENHLAYGKTLEQKISQEKKEQKKTNHQEQYQLLLWKLYAKALVSVVDKLVTGTDKKTTEPIKDVSIFSTTFLSQILTKLQGTTPEKESGNPLVKAAADTATERLFAQFFTQQCIETLQNLIKNLSQNTFQEVAETFLTLITVMTDLAPRYLPLMQEVQLPLFDTLHRLIPQKQYTILSEHTAAFINASTIIMQQAATTDNTLSQPVIIQQYLENIRQFIASTFELTKKTTTDAIVQAYQQNEATLSTMINTVLAKREQPKEMLLKIYENLVKLISYTSHKKHAEWSKKMQNLFVTILKPYTALCQDTKLDESFISTINIVGSQQSAAMLTASQAGKTMPPSIRMLLHTIDAAAYRCEEKSTGYKPALNNLQRTLKESAKEQQKQAIFESLKEQCMIRSQSIIANITKTFAPGAQSFVQLFALDSFDIDDFLHAITAQKQTQNQLINILKTKGKLYQQKLAIFFQEMLQKFSRLVTTKYQTLQRLQFALAAEAQKQYKTTDPKITNAAIRSWLLSTPLLYDYVRKRLRSAVISGNTTEILQSLVTECNATLPFLRPIRKKP